MTVVDFRSSGGLDGSQPGRLSHDYPHGQGHQGYQDDWQEDGWDDHAYDAHAGPLAESPSLLGRLSRLTHYLGALISVGLIVILAVWGFKLVVRDVSGVPVIRAIEGEARTAPDNPGGELTERTGLAVNSVAAGAEPARVDRVAIAPPATPLDGQDVPMGELGATAQEPSHPVELPLIEETARVIARPDGETLVEPDAVENAVISDAPAVDAPVNEMVTDLAGNETRDIAITTALAEAGAAPAPGAIAKSPRPAPRPRRVAASNAAAPAPSPTPAAAESRPAAAPDAPAPAAPQAPAQVASGAPLVQIGAFDSDALAKGEWNRVSGKFGALFAGKGMVVQEHKANGRTFWRLRASGFASRDEARRFCAALIAEGVDCIPAAAK
ncbi:SPOR domain-containing protein [Paracoccus sp. MA]|uniref:SPOR domain-containing protein n=1 Tax=Paracoccus sp. MA TaxID=2895796 RepID=UPI001E5D4620|nr:SPOR domain-containing protein [Paracoccus sp. MA]UFM63761.1 SPOR domain-containing protein [Paracoccus sp. MA]